MAQLLLRNYAMECFLERMSISDHKDNFILKGGMLISAVVGSHLRAVMDIDTTIRNYLLRRLPKKRRQGSSDHDEKYN